MPCEIELKAWVDDFPGVKASLSGFARLLHEFDKADSYFRKTAGGAEARIMVRIRNVVIIKAGSRDSSSYVTSKNKKRAGGIEVNEEIEFSVSDSAAAESLIVKLGAIPSYRKRKTGFAFESDGVFCELCHVEGLGDFLELEILSDTDNPDTIAAARKRLFFVLEKAGIPEEKVEEKFYSELMGV